MERLTAFNNGIWGISMKAVADGYDRYSMFSRLAEYENIGLTPQNIICREDDIKLLQKRNKEFREEIYKLKEERDYWEREAKKWCNQLGKIRVLIGGK